MDLHCRLETQLFELAGSEGPLISPLILAWHTAFWEMPLLPCPPALLQAAVSPICVYLAAIWA